LLQLLGRRKPLSTTAKLERTARGERCPHNKICRATDGTRARQRGTSMTMQKLAPAASGRNSGGEISWEQIQGITHGRMGRVMSICPLCSEHRRKHNRHSKVLAVTQLEPDFAVYYCNHCEAQGYARPDSPGRIIDFAEQQRLRNEAQ